jgi:hypothetical protein
MADRLVGAGSDGCIGAIQDFMTCNICGGMGPGQTFTSEVPGPGQYTFTINGFCDLAGSGISTGTANFDLDIP